MFTIRECIREMRKVFSSDVYLCNKTRIHIYEKNPNEWDCISGYKERNGEKILRRIFCSIEPNNRTIGLEELKKFSLFDPESEYNYFRENDYLIPERDMNLFISLNKEIDYYMTISQHAIMLSDSMI